jgi:type II restriction enzyme
MQFDELVMLYDKMKEKYGIDAYRHVTELLRTAKAIHKQGFENSLTARRAKAEGRVPDHEQSWRAFKGKNLEKLLMYMINDEVSTLGLRVIGGSQLERTRSENLSKELSQVRRNLFITENLVPICQMLI